VKLPGLKAVVLGLIGGGLLGLFLLDSRMRSSLEEEADLPRDFPSLAALPGGVDSESPGCLRVRYHKRSFRFVQTATALGRPWTVRGTFLPVSAHAVALNTPGGASIEVILNAASVDTDDPRRDEHLRAADLLDTARWATYRFRSTSMVLEGRELVLEGRLDLFGTSVVYREGAAPPFGAIRLEASEDPSDLGVSPVTLTGEFRSSRSRFGLGVKDTTSWARESVSIRIDDEVTFKVNFQLVPCSELAAG
jgi:hypothetical protein